MADDWRTLAACHPDRRPANMTAAEWTGIWYTPDAQVGRPPTAGINPDTYGPARRICEGCPVRDECLTEALESSDIRGMRGGFSPNQLRKMPRTYRPCCHKCGVRYVTDKPNTLYCSDRCRRGAHREVNARSMQRLRGAVA